MFNEGTFTDDALKVMATRWMKSRLHDEFGATIHGGSALTGEESFRLMELVKSARVEVSWEDDAPVHKPVTVTLTGASKALDW